MILDAGRVVEALPEETLRPSYMFDYIGDGRPWDPDYTQRRYEKLGSVAWENPQFKLIVAMRDGDFEGASQALAQGALRTTMVRVDRARSSEDRYDGDDRLKDPFDDLLPAHERDPGVRVMTLLEWIEFQIFDLKNYDSRGNDPWRNGRPEFNGARNGPHGPINLEEAVEQYRSDLLRVRTRVFGGIHGWLRARFKWKMRALVFYWAEMADQAFAPDRLDMAAELRAAMQGMEGATGSRLGTRGKPFAISKDDDPIIVRPTAPPEFLQKWAAARA